MKMEGFVFLQLGQVLHGEQVLRPVLEYRPVAPVGNQFVGVLGHCRIQVVLDHEHDGGCLLIFRRVLFDRSGVHSVCRPVAVQINASKFLQFLGAFRGHGRMVLHRNVAQGVLDGQYFFFRGENVLAFGCMGNRWVPAGVSGQVGRDSCPKGLLEVHKSVDLDDGFLSMAPFLGSNP